MRVAELVERGLDPLAFRWLTFQTRYRSEMDFTWEAMEDADRRVTQLRRRMVDWAPAAVELGDAAKGFDARFREALATDLHLPCAVVIVNELVSSPEVPAGEKFALLVAWDHVLGPGPRAGRQDGWEPTDEMRVLMAERDAARAAKDFATADEMRDRLDAMGLEVMDTAEGTTVRPRDRR